MSTKLIISYLSGSGVVKILVFKYAPSLPLDHPTGLIACGDGHLRFYIF